MSVNIPLLALCVVAVVGAFCCWHFIGREG